MSNIIAQNTPLESITIPEHWREFAAQASEYIAKSKADSTRLCYANDFLLFCFFCDHIRANAIPAYPEIVTMYVSNLASEGKKVSTIDRRIAAICHYHQELGFTSPTHAQCVKAALEGIRRTKGCAPEKKAAARVHHVVAMLAACPDSISGIRDRALFALALSGAYRGSEPLSLNIEDLSRVPEGYLVKLRKSKTDQRGKGKLNGIANGQHIRCADLLAAWIAQLNQCGIVSGPVFRPILKSGSIVVDPKKFRLGYRTFLKLVKRYAVQAGLDPVVFGTHSFRHGFVTESFANDAEIDDTMMVSGHKKYETLLGYKQDNDLFKRNPGRLFL